MEKVKTVWELRTYDVWGNNRDGYEVNETFRAGTVELDLIVETFNAGTPQQFKGASPSDKQIREVFGLHGNVQIDTDGDDTYITVNRARDGYPLGEMKCTSHDALSPIRPKMTQAQIDKAYDTPYGT